MKHLFLGVFCSLVLLSAVAWILKPRAATEGRIPLVWVSGDNPVRQGQIGLFNKLHPEYELRLDPDNTGMAKVIVQSLAGVGPDLFDCYDGYQLSAYVRSGIAQDVTDQLAAAGIDVRRDVWRAAHPNVIHDDGRVYGFPTNVAVNAMWINERIFAACGEPLPHGAWTWDEFLPLAKRLTVRDERGRIQHFGLLCDWWNWKQFILQWGGRVYNEDGTRCVIDSPEAVAGVQFLHDLIYVHRVMPSPIEEAALASTGGWGGGTIHLFGGGKAAMALGGRWWLCALRGETFPDLELGAVPCPFGPKKVYHGYARATLINRHGPRRDHALQFLLYEAGREYNMLVNHQADALAPVRKYAFTREYLHDPGYPEEDFNAVWRDVMEYGVPDQVSPFINGHRANTILTRQLDLVRNDQKPVADALAAAARQINEEILETVKRDPELHRTYCRLTGEDPL